jgi:UDP-glucose 4-epimerase
VRVLRLPFVYGDGDPHIAEAIPMMRAFPPTQLLSIRHHADIAHAVARVLDGSDAERARAFDTPLDGRRVREDLGFKPRFPRLADAIAAGA